MRRILMAASAALLLVIFSALAASAAPVIAGVGREEIALDEGMPLSGYGNRTNVPHTGVHDKTYIRALILESRGRRAGIISGDYLMVTLELREELAERVSDLRLDLLAVTATHTHYGIGAYVDNKVAEIAVMGKYDPAAFEVLVSTMEAALRKAAANMKPAKIGHAIVDAPGVTSNRRHEGGPTDRTFRVIGVFGRDGALMAAIMNHAIHPTTMPSSTTLVSGDCTGAAESYIETRRPGSVAMFLNAGLGDQSPYKGWGEVDWDVVEEVGHKMGESAEAALASMRPASDVELTLYHHEFDMPKPSMRLSLECWGGLNQLMPLVGGSMIREQGVLMGVGINNALLLFAPGELAVEVQEMIVDEFPDRDVFVVTHANDIYGYVVTAEDYKTGGYETCLNFYGPGFAGVLTEEFGAMVEGE